MAKYQDYIKGRYQVSIPKRVSEVLWRYTAKIALRCDPVSIPKRVSEVLWHKDHFFLWWLAVSFNP